MRKSVYTLLLIAFAIAGASVAWSAPAQTPRMRTSPSPSLSPSISPSPSPSASSQNPRSRAWKLTNQPSGGFKFELHWDPLSGPERWTLYFQKTEERFKQQIEAAYKGAKLPIAPTMQTPICNLAEGEINTNHLGQSCGASTCEFEAVCARCGSSTCPFWLKGQRDNKVRDLPKTCERERAWKRGAFIQEVVLAKQQIFEQIAAEGAIWIGARCDITHWASSPRYTEKTWNQLLEWRALAQGQYDNCNLKEEDNDNGAPVQAPCQLVASTLAQTAAIADATVCEIFARAEERWLNRDGPAFEDMTAQTREASATKCQRETQDNRSKMAPCTNKDYASNIQANLKATLPQAADHPWPPQTEEAYVAASTPSKPVAGVVSCPSGAADCLQCQGDAVACPGAGQAFLSIKLDSMLQAKLFVTLVDNLHANARQFISDALSYHVTGKAKHSHDERAGENNSSEETYGGINSAPPPSPSPSPSPSASASPSPLPWDQYPELIRPPEYFTPVIEFSGPRKRR